MRTYLMNLAGAIIVTAFSDVLLPDKWSKYVKIITGLIIISAIATPVKDKINFDISSYLSESEQLSQQGEEYSKKLVANELERKINEDCELRILEEFNIDSKVLCTISINEKNEITGIEEINIIAQNVGKEVVSRINEVYAPKEVRINGN